MKLTILAENDDSAKKCADVSVAKGPCCVGAPLDIQSPQAFAFCFLPRREATFVFRSSLLVTSMMTIRMMA